MKQFKFSRTVKSKTDPYNTDKVVSIVRKEVFRKSNGGILRFEYGVAQYIKGVLFSSTRMSYANACKAFDNY